MDYESTKVAREVVGEENPHSLEMDVASIESSVLARLVEEVRNEQSHSINAYNRMHNRHNRSR